MIRTALDSNLLIYAELTPDDPKGIRSRAVITAAVGDGVVAMQVFGELLNVVQRKRPDRIGEATAQTGVYEQHFRTPLTSIHVLRSAVALCAAFKLQFWDATIIAASSDAGAQVLLSEDMQDGQIIGGLRILNPFNSANDAEIDALFTP